MGQVGEPTIGSTHLPHLGQQQGWCNGRKHSDDQVGDWNCKIYSSLPFNSQAKQWMWRASAVSSPSHRTSASGRGRAHKISHAACGTECRVVRIYEDLKASRLYYLALHALEHRT
ncbi:hypothetical protein Fot_14530 [Forsythia ovata]|uniref:Uncharacterized protein n=1 Tax=Forsythia ovata TaxID=205694 RepID=A0ABD1W6W5_9LAMI